jgi:hypothetical protein
MQSNFRILCYGLYRVYPHGSLRAQHEELPVNQHHAYIFARNSLTHSADPINCHYDFLVFSPSTTPSTAPQYSSLCAIACAQCALSSNKTCLTSAYPFFLASSA